VNDRVAVLERLDEAADEALGALGGSVDGNETERTLGSRHDYCGADEIPNGGRGESFFIILLLELATVPHIVNVGRENPGIDILRHRINS